MPIAYIFGGVNGAGKTTLYYNELEKKSDFGFRINIDEIVSSFGDWRDNKDQIRASKIAISLRENYINKQVSFNQETTLCGNSILRLFENLKSKHYKIQLYYIGVDSLDIAKARVAMRVSKGGHNIPEKLIEKRYTQSFENLNKSIELCDEIYLFDNTYSLTKLAKIRKNQLETNFTKLPKWIQGLKIEKN